MRVILLSAPASKGLVSPILGLGYIAASLEKAGHNVKIIDPLLMQYKTDDILKLVKDFRADSVGISSTTQHIFSAYAFFKQVKDYNSNILTVLGGPHPTVLAKETLQECPYVDVIVRGEGEITFVELLEKINNLSMVKGITYRTNNQIFENESRKPIENLDELPFPAYHLMPMNRYKDQFIYYNLDFSSKNDIRSGLISTSRGCPYNCIFCASRALWGKNVRSRSPENVIEELRILKDKYKVSKIDFMDDTFSLDKSRIERICNLIKQEGIDITWSCGTRVELFNDKLAKCLKKGGCYLVYFGFESANQETLDFLCKGFKVEDIICAVKNAKENQLLVNGTFILGVPGDTKDMINHTINFAEKLNLNSPSFSMLVPFPGTRIYEIAKQNNLLITEDWSKFSPSNPILKVKGLTTFELKCLYKKAIYYARLAQIFNIKSKQSLN